MHTLAVRESRHADCKVVQVRTLAFCPACSAEGSFIHRHSNTMCMALALWAAPLLAPWCPSMLASCVACNTCASLQGCAAGHALAAPPPCAGRRAGLVLTRSVWYRILNPSYDVSVSPSFPIQVSAAAGTATVQAGVPQRILLDYLAAHRRARGGCGRSAGALVPAP